MFNEVGSFWTKHRPPRAPPHISIVLAVQALERFTISYNVLLEVGR
jgi:hypothetical protein